MDHKLLRQEYERLYDVVRAILAEDDPLGIAFHPNEYDPEVGTILPRLRRAATIEDVTRIVYEEFVRWFDSDIAGPMVRYQPIAEQIWHAYLQSSDRRG